MSWDQKKIEILRNEWGKGKTASQIAEMIGGVSRNAVIGKAHRLNLSIKIKSRNNIDDFVYEDFELINYEHHPHIAAKVAV